MVKQSKVNQDAFGAEIQRMREENNSKNDKLQVALQEMVSHKEQASAEHQKCKELKQTIQDLRADLQDSRTQHM